MPRGRGESPGACETGTTPPPPRLPRTLPRPHAAPSLIPVHLIMTSSSRPRDPGAETQAWGRSTDNAPQSRMPRSLTRRPRFLPNAPTPHRPWRLPLLRAGPLGPHGLPKPCPRGRDGGKRTVPSSPALGTQPTCPRLPGRKETGGGASSRLPMSSKHQPLRGRLRGTHHPRTGWSLRAVVGLKRALTALRRPPSPLGRAVPCRWSRRGRGARQPGGPSWAPRPAGATPLPLGFQGPPRRTNRRALCRHRSTEP